MFTPAYYMYMKQSLLDAQTVHVLYTCSLVSWQPTYAAAIMPFQHMQGEEGVPLLALHVLERHDSGSIGGFRLMYCTMYLK